MITGRRRQRQCFCYVDFSFVQGIAVLFRNGVTMLLVLLADVGVFYVVLNGLLLKEKLKKGIEEIAWEIWNIRSRCKA